MKETRNLKSLYHSYPSITFKKGELILQPSTHISHIYYVIEGYVRMFTLLPNGKELTITLFKPDSFFPLFLAIDERENTYYFESFTPSVIKRIPTENVLSFIKNNHDVLYDFTRRTSRGMQGVLENLQYQLFGSVTQRTIETLLMLARRFGKKKGNGVQIDLPISHQDIANFVGVARETISIEMSKLQKLGLIQSSYKKILIEDVQTLRSFQAI